MFRDARTFSSFSVDDISKVKSFYSDTLGLKVDEQPEGLGLQLAGGGSVFIYPKGEGHVPATYTVLNFSVDNLDAAVDALVQKGVRFERYDGMNQDAKGIARSDGQGPNIAWFKDPAGNILSVLDGM
jgi:catechol 2,3-dioxygenase-like lactoylglutathione lyase family enzyme